MTQTTRVSGVATSVFTDTDGALCVKYHHTIVWKLHSDGMIELNTGGWRTVTTKVRMNQAFHQYGPRVPVDGESYQIPRYGVFQKKGDWYLWDRKSNTNTAFDDETLYVRNCIC
jgi:hypothetical protein